MTNISSFPCNIITTILFLRIPYQYRERLYDLCQCRDNELAHQWDGFIPCIVNEWTQLNIVVRWSFHFALCIFAPSENVICLAGSLTLVREPRAAFNFK
jgi:hypothetical protein